MHDEINEIDIEKALMVASYKWEIGFLFLTVSKMDW